MLEVCVLDGFQVRNGDVAVAVPEGFPRQILAQLVAHPTGMSTDRLTMALWGADASPTRRRCLQVHVSNLRRALLQWLPVTDTAVIHHSQSGGYRLDPTVISSDIERFRQHRAAVDALAADGMVEEAVDRGVAGLDMWGYGEPFDGIGSCAALHAVCDGLRRAHRDLSLQVGGLAMDCGRLTDARQILQDAVRREPLDEELAVRLMNCVVQLGTPGDALLVGNRLVTDLRRELSCSPGLPVVDLLRRIRLGDMGSASQARCRRPSPRPRCLLRLS